MLKNYRIAITSNKEAPQIADNVARDFECSISDPSIWVAPGSTSEKGLSFLDNKGHALNSILFKNQAYFTPSLTANQTEAQAIELYIYNILFEHYRFDKTDINVTVTER